MGYEKSAQYSWQNHSTVRSGLKNLVIQASPNGGCTTTNVVRVLDELHDGAVLAVYIDGWSLVGVHGNATNLANISERQDVCDRRWIEPNLTKVWEITNLRRVLITAIGNGTKGATTVADVLDHGRVIKHRDGTL
jgi:hypothetical protein